VAIENKNKPSEPILGWQGRAVTGRPVRSRARQQLMKVAGVVVCIAGVGTQAFGQAAAMSPLENSASKAVVQTPPQAPPPPFRIYGWIEGGITGNPDSPIDNHNFGQLYTDRANEPLLNQLSIVAERTLDSTATGFAWGFKIWFMYGSDARYTKSMGFLDLVTDNRIQPAFPELYVSAHIPIGATGGLDLKLGEYADPMSAETIDPRNNIFYSHSYIFNFGVPTSDTGLLGVFHVNKYVDIYAGINRGANVSVFNNNSSYAFEGGIGFNLWDGNLTSAALTSIGPEDPGNNHDYRYISDWTTTWKITKVLTAITDLNLVYDQLGSSWGGGGAQYFTYSVTDWLTLGLRAEIWRDENSLYVGQFRANNDYIHILRGDVLAPDPSTYFGGRTTYFEITWGVTLKPPVPQPLAALLIRPEVRYDRALSNASSPFDQHTSRDQCTLALDLVLEF
jgi:hypothetical protein